MQLCFHCFLWPKDENCKYDLHIETFWTAHRTTYRGEIWKLFKVPCGSQFTSVRTSPRSQMQSMHALGLQSEGTLIWLIVFVSRVEGLGMQFLVCCIRSFGPSEVQMVPVARNLVMRSSLYSSSFRTVSVCSPNTGGVPMISDDALIFIGMPVIRTFPAVG